MTVNTSEQDSKTSELQEEFKDVFIGQGCLMHECNIQIKPEGKPVVHAAGTIPVSLKDKVKLELERMVKLNIIQKVDELSEWINSMVVVPKSNGEVRICLDPRNLNSAIKREHYLMQTLNEVTKQLASAKYFSVLDATSSWLLGCSTLERIIAVDDLPYTVW